MTRPGDVSPTNLEFEQDFQRKVDERADGNDTKTEPFPKLLLEKLHILIPPPVKFRDKSDSILSSPRDLVSPSTRFPPTKGARAKSLTEAEIRAIMSTKEEVGEIFEDLVTSPLPLDMNQARARRASIKQERKENIAFIRSRTNSRASAIEYSRRNSIDPKEVEKPRSAFAELTKKLESCDSLFEEDEEDEKLGKAEHNVKGLDEAAGDKKA